MNNKPFKNSDGNIIQRIGSALRSSDETPPPGLGILLIAVPLVGYVTCFVVYVLLGFVLSLLATLGDPSHNASNARTIMFGWSLYAGYVTGALVCITSWYLALSRRDTWDVIGGQLKIGFYILCVLVLLVGLALVLGRFI